MKKLIIPTIWAAFGATALTLNLHDMGFTLLQTGGTVCGIGMMIQGISKLMEILD